MIFLAIIVPLSCVVSALLVTPPESSPRVLILVKVFLVTFQRRLDNVANSPPPIYSQIGARWLPFALLLAPLYSFCANVNDTVES